MENVLLFVHTGGEGSRSAPELNHRLVLMGIRVSLSFLHCMNVERLKWVHEGRVPRSTLHPGLTSSRSILERFLELGVQLQNSVLQTEDASLRRETQTSLPSRLPRRVQTSAAAGR